MVLPVQPALTPRSCPIFRPVLCVQYKGEYSCMLRTTSNQDPKALMVLKQFHDDMQALRLEPPIEPDKVEFIKKSSQVKATYSVRHRSSCDILRSLVIRTFSSGGFKEACAERFIAHVLYIEGCTTVSSDTISTISTVQRRLEESTWSSPSSEAPTPLIKPSQISACRITPIVFRGKSDLLCDKATMAGSASLKLPSRHIQNDAKRGPVLHQAQLQTPRPAGLDINSLRIRSAVRQQPTHPPISTMVSLTPNTCSRLRDRGDSDVLSSEPTVRVLVLKDVRPDDAPEGIRRMAFITDGEDFTFVALSQTSGDPDGWMYPGAAIRLTSVHRLPDGFTCPVVVNDFRVDFSDQADPDNAEMQDSPSLVMQSLSTSTTSTMDTDGSGPTLIDSLRERIEELTGEVQEERARRRQLERALADVCQLLTPAAVDILHGIYNIADSIGDQ